MSVRQHAGAAFCAAAAIVLSASVATAQDVTGPNLKAAYVHKFALFTEWPAQALPAPGSPMTMCVVGDTDVREALERTVAGLTLFDRPVVVVFRRAGQPLPQCHLLYVSAISSAQTARLIAEVETTPVLTISDIEGFNGMGGIAEFFYEAGQLRFSISTDAAAKAGLRLSSRLLILSRTRR